MDNVVITFHLGAVGEARDEGSAVREEDAGPVGDHHLCRIGNGIGDSVAAHVPRDTGRRIGLDARDIHTQIGDGIRHGEGIAVIERLSRRIQRDPEFRVDVTAIHVKILFRSQKLFVEAVVGVCDRCGIGLAFPCSRVRKFGCTAGLYSLQLQLVKSSCVLDRQVVDQFVVGIVGVVVLLSDLVGAGHSELDAARDVLVRNRSGTLSVQTVLLIAAEQIVGILAAVVQFQNAGVEFVLYGDAVAVDTGDGDLVPVDRQRNPINRTRSHRLAVFLDGVGSDIGDFFIAHLAFMRQSNHIQVFDHAFVRLGILKPSRIDFGLVGDRDLPWFTRSPQTRLPVVGKGDGHSVFTIVGGTVVYRIVLAGQKAADLQAARDDVFNKGISRTGRDRRILVVHNRPGQAIARDIDDGLPRDFHAVLVDIRHGLVDIDDAVIGSDSAIALVLLAAVGHNDVAHLSPQRKVGGLDIGRIGDLVSVGMARI